MSTTINPVAQQQAIDTAANWTAANPVLLYGQLGIEAFTFKIKAGDGTTARNSLPYATSPTQQLYNDQFVGDGTTTAFTLTKTPSGASPAGVFVTDGGVPQAKANFSYSGTTFTMGYAPLSGNLVTICYIA